MIKSPAEIDLMRLASSVLSKLYEAAEVPGHGMTRISLRPWFRRRTISLGFQGSAGVQVAEFSALPHGSAKPQIVRPGRSC